MSRTAEIKVTVNLDDENLATRIEWQASEGPNDKPMRCQSMMLSLWDNNSRKMAAIDLWTKDTTVDDMSLYFYQAFHTMAETYLRATKNNDVAKLIHNFGNEFGEKLGLR